MIGNASGAEDSANVGVKRGVHIYKAWTKYYAGNFYWTLNIRFSDYRVWSASDGKNDEYDWEDDDDEEWDDDMVTD